MVKLRDFPFNSAKFIVNFKDFFHYPFFAIMNPFPIGTFFKDTGAPSEETCTPCTAGFYCNPATVTPSLKCQSGYYCPGGSKKKDHVICPAGHKFV